MHRHQIDRAGGFEDGVRFFARSERVEIFRDAPERGMPATDAPDQSRTFLMFSRLVETAAAQFVDKRGLAQHRIDQL